MMGIVESLLRTGHIWLIDCPPAHHRVAADERKAFHRCKNGFAFCQKLDSTLTKHLVEIVFSWDICQSLAQAHFPSDHNYTKHTALRLMLKPHTLALRHFWYATQCNPIRQMSRVHPGYLFPAWLLGFNSENTIRAWKLPEATGRNFLAGPFMKTPRSKKTVISVASQPLILLFSSVAPKVPFWRFFGLRGARPIRKVPMGITNEIFVPLQALLVCDSVRPNPPDEPSAPRLPFSRMIVGF